MPGGHRRNHEGQVQAGLELAGDVVDQPASSAGQRLDERVRQSLGRARHRTQLRPADRASLLEHVLEGIGGSEGIGSQVRGDLGCQLSRGHLGGELGEAAPAWTERGEQRGIGVCLDRRHRADEADVADAVAEDRPRRQRCEAAR